MKAKSVLFQEAETVAGPIAGAGSIMSEFTNGQESEVAPTNVSVSDIPRMQYTTSLPQLIGKHMLRKHQSLFLTAFDTIKRDNQIQFNQLGTKLDLLTSFQSAFATPATLASPFAPPPWSFTYTPMPETSVPVFFDAPMHHAPVPSTTTQVQAPSPAVLARAHDTTVPHEQIPPNNRQTYILPSGESIVFDKTVPLADLPAIHYSSRISQLFVDWHDSDFVRLNGRSIPIRYWQHLYTRLGKTGQWGTNRNEWGNWKVRIVDTRMVASTHSSAQFIVDEKDYLGSEEAFWQKFTDSSGGRLGYQAILDRLQSERKQRDKLDSAAALRYFNNDLSAPLTGGAFQYLKSGKTYVLRRPDKVAEVWRRLLQEDPDIAGQWAVMQASAGE